MQDNRDASSSIRLKALFLGAVATVAVALTVPLPFMG